MPARSALPARALRQERFLRTVIDLGAASIKRGANRKAPSHPQLAGGQSAPTAPLWQCERVHHAEYQTAAKTR